MDKQSKIHPYYRNSLTQDEINELKTAFDLFDVKGKGFIEVSELKNTMKQIDRNGKNLIVADIIESMSGQVDFEKFLEIMTQTTATTDSKENIYRVFQLLSDNSDFITLDKLQQAVFELGEPLSHFDLREMIERADVDGDNKISFEEFYNIMTNKNLDYEM